MKVRPLAGPAARGGGGTAEGVSGLQGVGRGDRRGDLRGWGRLKGPPGGARLQEVTPTCAGPGASAGTSYPNSYGKGGLGELLSELEVP